MSASTTQSFAFVVVRVTQEVFFLQIEEKKKKEAFFSSENLVVWIHLHDKEKNLELKSGPFIFLHTSRQAFFLTSVCASFVSYEK